MRPSKDRAQVLVRPAEAADQDSIVALVHSERLNPNGLAWRRFVVAVVNGQLVGAVQLRQHRDGSRELGSLVVALRWRQRGIAARMIDHLLSDQAGPVHMITGATHAQRYRRWEFCAVDRQHAPRSVRLNHLLGRLATLVSRLRGRQVRQLVILERAAKQSV